VKKRGKLKLYLDTSNNKKTIVKLGDLEIIEEYKSFNDQRLLAVIDKALKKKKAMLQDIKSIEVNKGPGSFTGLRIACAVANTLAWALKIKVNGRDRVEPIYKA
jgi:tRNA threonylcarbamoyladenosine biosynthesis protein TsaB